MGQILTDLGEEWLVKFDVTGRTPDVGLYNDGTDAITDTDDLSAITTEPSDGNYTRQADQAFSAEDLSGDWGIDNDSKITYDVTNTTGTVDGYFFVDNFQATDTGDGSANDHLILTGALSQSYDLSNLDTLEISAGGSGFSVT